jgi:hypothetical protein
VEIDCSCSSSSRQKTRASTGLGFGWGFTEAHLGLLVDNLAVALGCGVSEKLGDVVREVNVDAAGS